MGLASFTNMRARAAAEAAAKAAERQEEEKKPLAPRPSGSSRAVKIEPKTEKVEK